MKLGNSIREIRKLRGLSQEELAASSGLVQNVISRIERDSHRPTEKTLAKLAEVLNVHQDAFYYWSIVSGQGSSKLSPLQEKLAPLIKEEMKELFDLNAD